MRGLKRIAISLDGARAVVSAGVFDCLPGMLQARSALVREYTAKVLGTLGTHDFGLTLLLKSNLFVSLLRQVPFATIETVADDTQG
jgi:hypothetical protein